MPDPYEEAALAEAAVNGFEVKYDDYTGELIED